MCTNNVEITKDQEREALEQIKALVAGLGPNSYIATAFPSFDRAGLFSLLCYSLVQNRIIMALACALVAGSLGFRLPSLPTTIPSAAAQRRAVTA